VELPIKSGDVQWKPPPFPSTPTISYALLPPTTLLYGGTADGKAGPLRPLRRLCSLSTD